VRTGATGAFSCWYLAVVFITREQKCEATRFYYQVDSKHSSACVGKFELLVQLDLID
jgi:hypothetical protein